VKLPRKTRSQYLKMVPEPVKYCPRGWFVSMFFYLLKMTSTILSSHFTVDGNFLALTASSTENTSILI
jgi:hypothetical protein